MSEDNKQLEEQSLTSSGSKLSNQEQTPKEPSGIEDNASNPNSYSHQSLNEPSTVDNVSVDSNLTGALSQPEDILANLAEQLGANQQGNELLAQLQQIIATLTQDKEILLQTQENLSGQLEEQNQQIESTKRRYISLAAEFDNFRKRTLREKEDFEKQAKRKTLNELLTVVDDFERARRLIQPANDGEMAIHKSYQGVYKKFVDGLKSLGVSAMRPEGQPFDPMYHEALLSEPTDEYPEGTIIEELDRGYLLDDQVLRYAKVKVAAPKDPDSETSKTTETISDAQESNT